jgi:hypothetical protein
VKSVVRICKQDYCIQAKLCRMFDPFSDMIGRAPPGIQEVAVRACVLAEKPALNGATAAILLGGAKSALMNWQSKNSSKRLLWRRTR